MPEQKRSGRAKGVPHHPLVEALAADPNQPPKRATRIFGYPGPAASPKSTRLWLDHELTGYVDVPDDAILYHHTLADDAGTLLWVDPTATLTHSAPQEQEVQAEFLGGAIAQRNLAAAAFGPGGNVPVEQSWDPNCAPWASRLWDCLITRNLACRHSFPWCRVEREEQIGGRVTETYANVCQSVNLCVTDSPPCQKFHTTFCITPHFPCVGVKVESNVGPCPEPWQGGITPVVDRVGPFRPQQ